MRVLAGHVNWEEVWPPTSVKIKVDANAGEPLESIVHELIHVVLYPMTLGHIDATLDEVLVVAMTSYVYDFIAKNPARLKQWNILVKRKLKESSASQDIPVPFEKQVKRKEAK